MTASSNPAYFEASAERLEETAGDKTSVEALLDYDAAAGWSA